MRLIYELRKFNFAKFCALFISCEHVTGRSCGGFACFFLASKSEKLTYRPVVNS